MQKHNVEFLRSRSSYEMGLGSRRAEWPAFDTTLLADMASQDHLPNLRSLQVVLHSIFDPAFPTSHATTTSPSPPTIPGNRPSLAHLTYLNLTLCAITPTALTHLLQNRTSLSKLTYIALGPRPVPKPQPPLLPGPPSPPWTSPPPCNTPAPPSTASS